MKIRMGIRTKLLGMTLGLLAVLTMGALATVHYYVGQQIREQAQRKLRAGAHVLASILERTQEQLLERGRILVELPSLRAGLTDSPETLESLLQEVKAVRTANLLWATDAQGTVLASTEEYPPLRDSLAQHPFVSVALTNERAIGFDVFLDDWWLLLCLPVTAEDSSELIGTVTLGLLVGESYLTRLSELVETDVSFRWEQQQFWSSGWPRESRGQVTASALSAPPGAVQELALEAEARYLWMPRPVTVGIYPRETKMITLLGTRLDTAVIQQLARTIGWIALLTMAGGALLLRGGIRSVTKPLKTLVADSERVGAGDLSHRAQVHGADEVAELAASFNQMVGKLRQSRDELVQAKDYMDKIIQRTINSLIVVDANQTIRSMNPATEELLGYSAAELLGKSVSVVFDEKVTLFKGDRWNTFLDQGVIRNLQTTYRSKHGKAIPVLFSGAVMRDEEDRVQGVVCVAQDITERKELEDLKDDFLNTVSHELRTPLASSRAATSLVLDGSLGPLNEQQQSCLQTIDRSTRRLVRLVNTLLDISIMDSGKMALHREPVKLDELIRESCRSYQSMAGKRTITPRLTQAPAVSIDRARILEVLGHLLSNAIQFTPDDGRIIVSLASRERELMVSVQDNGRGIPREEFKQLFQKFAQPGRAQDERSGGTGLGLVFCKKMLELHGGAITATSEVGKGSTFTFTLPTHESV